MKKTKMGQAEIQKMILESSKIIHDVLTKNGIPYYMLGGSILGAIRHKGFIPWDDDFDIGVPRVYWNQMVCVLRNQLPDTLNFLDYESSKGVFLGMGKVECRNTKVNEFIYRDLPEEDKLGISIDIFPLDQISLPFPTYKKIRFLQRLQFLLFSVSKENSLKKKVARVIARVICLGILRVKKNDIPRKIDTLAKKNANEKGGYYLSTWSHYYLNVAEIDTYGKPTLYPFEDTYFYGPEKADAYLTKLFGDYMKLPPKEKQVYHSEDVFLIEQG